MSRTRVDRSGAAAARGASGSRRRRPRGHAGPSIFLCYRREDTAGHTGRLYDRLSEHFGRGRVFVDIDTIEPGEDFVDVIDAAIGGSDVFLVLIGDEWVVDAAGRRRLDDPNDFVRLELAAALAKDARVIPILVEDADMPSPEDIPAELRPVTRRNALPLSNTRWQYDTDRLIATIEHVLRHDGELPVPAETWAVPSAPSRRSPGRGLVGLVLFALIAAAAVAAVLLLGDGTAPAPEEPATATAPTTAVAPALIRVPQVVGRTEADAIDALVEAGFDVDSDPGTSDAAAGIVFDQDPGGGVTAPEGSEVQIVVSTGAAPETPEETTDEPPEAPTVVVPDVVGVTIADARSTLERLGLVVDETRTESAEPEGVVVSQEPEAGVTVDEAAAVSVTVSAGVVRGAPDVVGISPVEARERLAEAGYEMRFEAFVPTTNPDAADTIARQEPKPGALPENGVVRVWIYASEPTFTFTTPRS